MYDYWAENILPSIRAFWSVYPRYAKLKVSYLYRFNYYSNALVGEDPRRVVRPVFIETTNKDLEAFGELQAHRKIFGLLGVVFVPTVTGESDALAALGAARVSYDQAKVSSSDTPLTLRFSGRIPGYVGEQSMCSFWHARTGKRLR
jgi:hypothetical protein